MNERAMKVKAAGTAMVPDYEALEGGVLRFVGRRHDPSIGHDRPAVKGVRPADTAGGWVPTGEAVELPFRAEYVEEVRAGALEACDEWTAALCSVPFTS